MKFQIKEILLWPRNHAKSVRRLEFNLGSVTVISGASRTGKSAVIPIIDYCLAANDCSIPSGTIRNACDWFGVVISTDSGYLLLARREPGSQRSTDDMCMAQSSEIEIPERPTKNTNASNVRRALDELCGLSNLDFSSGEGGSGFDSRPSFRDLAAFTFQPQNVVANPDVLFFKTSTYEHRERLRKIFPYVLGAITPELLAKQHELKRLQSELRRKEKELKQASTVSDQWTAELKVKFAEAQELGLIPNEPNRDLPREQILEKLEEIVKRTDLTLLVSSATLTDAMKEFSRLEGEETTISQTLTALRRRLGEMSRVRDSASNYHNALRVQRERLQISDWLVGHCKDGSACPICGGKDEAAIKGTQSLHSKLKAIESETGQVVEIPVAFDREFQRVQADIGLAADKLKAIQLRKSSIASRSNEAKQRQFQAQKAERFVGNLENALELQRKLGEDSELKTEVAALRERETKLFSELRGHNIDTRKKQALSIVNHNAGKWLPHLDAERPNDPISLEIDDLTIKVIGTDRADLLSEIGSGSNWLAYHVAVTVALQQYFLRLPHSCVPGFLIFDQPSQVYFPKRVAGKIDEALDPKLRDEDIDAVRKVFQVLAASVIESQGQLQIIVLDHAPREVWGDIEGVGDIEEWRDGRKLVPLDWLVE
jgi:Protein of unknown function (DUF3732)